ncbi:cell division protein SepF [Desulfallas thermosapovorans]|uniref:Cell division protein SepF n=1 Tax=Desulfallas thermosapovorans DSM 6562 TaxID=1121431 RepID=A0A5S4ZSG2_9FIRM|nr:cell division protein SepF [Desulfallas thermosapovorans]TYO95879.1 cell division inhibitor SepF [Desulfallas thermosapovorans DSM 6562]
MARLVDKMLNFMGFEEEQEESREQEIRALEEEKTIIQKPKKNKAQVVSLHSQRQMRFCVVEPSSFDDVQGMADHLKNRRPVIVNLEQAEPELAKRVVDFVSGATYALDGSMQKVGKGIFLFVPSNVDIDMDIKEKISEKGILGWMK